MQYLCMNAAAISYPQWATVGDPLIKKQQSTEPELK